LPSFFALAFVDFSLNKINFRTFIQPQPLSLATILRRKKRNHLSRLLDVVFTLNKDELLSVILIFQ
jgi:hypothetical protein